MAIPAKVLHVSGRALTQADIADFDRLNYPADSKPSNEELLQLLWVRGDCWGYVLDAGLPVGSDMATLKTWLLANGWATSFTAPLERLKAPVDYLD